MEDFILKEMEERDADGVDFVPVLTNPDNILYQKIIITYTKKEWIASNRAYPKSGRIYWKVVNGKKEYIWNKKGV
jgi:hypothetical protein